MKEKISVVIPVYNEQESIVCTMEDVSSILEKNEELKDKDRIQKISSTFVKKVVSGDFYKFARTHDLRSQLLDELKYLDEGKYSEIRVQHQVQNKSKINRPWEGEETEALEKVLLEFLDGKDIGKNLPPGVFDFVSERFNESGFDRTYQAVKNKIEEIWHGKKKITLTRGSPESNFEGLTELINGNLENMVEDIEIEDIVDIDEDGKRREEYLENSTFGHQALVAYLINPKNYKLHLGDDLELVAVDFNKENTPAELFMDHKKQLKDLEDHLVEDEVIDFVDSWMRCDMIFRDDEGFYTVVEVKQNAVNREEYANADKARQQLAAYTAVISDNIGMRNSESGKPSPERVKGVLTAFNIEDALKDFFSISRGRRAAVEISKEDVYAYVEDALKRVRANNYRIASGSEEQVLKEAI